VTHDRYFLDKVATGILAFEGGGRVTRYPGNYETYRSLKEQAGAAARIEARPDESSPSPRRGEGRGEDRRAPGRKAGKLSFKEQRELEGMERAILAAEERKTALETALSDPATYQKEGAAVASLRVEFEEVTSEVERLYARWQELEALQRL
jgi:ATP-binding cassette subfamily F protein uup